MALNRAYTFGNQTGPIPLSYLDAMFTNWSQTVVNSLAELRTVPKTGAQAAFVLGSSTAGDGAGQWYWYNPADTTSADNGTSIIVASDGGRWYWAPVGLRTTGFQSRIINGGMRFDQRYRGAVITPTGGGYLLDRWQGFASVGSAFTAQQVADSPVGGYGYCLQVKVGTPATATATQQFYVAQRIEGPNIADFVGLTANALQITTSYQVKTSIVGTYCVSVYNPGQNRSYVGTYTISQANVWTPIVITITGDAVGSWTTTAGQTGLMLTFDLGSGSNFNTTAGAWATGNFTRTASAVSFVSQIAGSTWNLSMVQLQTGGTASPFETPPYGYELGLCRRYTRYIPRVPGQCTNTTAAVGAVDISDMPIPAVSLAGAGTWNVYNSYGTLVAVTGTPTLNFLNATAQINVAVSSGLTAGNATVITPPSYAYFDGEIYT